MSYKLEKQENGKYKIRVWGGLDIFGKVRTKQISNISGLTTAKKLALQLEVELKDENSRDRGENNFDMKFSTLEQLYFHERESKISPTTLESFKFIRTKILEYFGNLKVRYITTPVVQGFIDKEQKTGLKKKTVKNYVSYVVAVINWGINFNYVDSNKINRLNYAEDEEDFEPTPLSIEQVVDILPVMKHECYNIYIPSLISILTSARRGEVLGLRWEDLDFEHNVISFRKNMISPNGKAQLRNRLKTKKSTRDNPMADFLKEELLEHKNKFALPSSQFVCSNIFIGEVTPDYLSHMVHDFVLNKFNIDMREHDLRHTFSQLIEDNEDVLIEKSQMMGHSNLFTTKYYYTKPSFVRKLKIANALGDLIKSAMCET